MTDEDGQEKAQEAGGASAAGMIAKMGLSETMIVLGAAVVMAVWVLFDLLIDEYNLDAGSFVLAVFILGAAYSNQKRVAEPAVPHTTVMFVAGGLLGIVGVAFMVEELRDGILGTDFLTVTGGLAYYAGAIVSGIGALQLRQR